MNNLFTIITPTFNRLKKTLPRAVNSVLKQTYTEFEYIIVDDGSKDQEDVKKYVEELKDDRVKFIAGERSNRYFNYNRGIKAAKNEWLIFLDDDNELSSICLEILIKNINDYPKYSIFNWPCLVYYNGGIPRMVHKYGVRQLFKPIETEKGYVHFESGKIDQCQFAFKRKLMDEIGLIPEARSPWKFADMAKIPGYGSLLKPCGNPWGQDFWMIYKLTRNNKMKGIDVILAHHFIK